MIKEILINFLIENFDSDLRHNRLDNILESIYKDSTYADKFGKLVKDDYFSYKNLKTLLYILFKKQFNIDILDKLIRNNRLQITVDKLALNLNEELSGSRTLYIDIENKNIDNDIEIKGGWYHTREKNSCIIRFSDDISNFPNNYDLHFCTYTVKKIILPKNLSGLFSMSYFHSLDDDCKLYFTPVMRDGELATKFDILDIMKDEYLKHLRPISSFKESLEEDNTSLIEMFKDKFYKYSGLDRNNRITQENINDERLRALGRISIESGYSVDYIEESLLK